MTPTARFLDAFGDLLGNEGFYSNDPVDAGGETVYGVSRRAHPDWLGWKIVDAARGKAGFPGILRSDQELLGAARELYYDVYWTPVGAARLPHPVGERLFDIAVNAGHATAGLCLQVALCALDVYVRVDGQIGPATLAAAARFDSEPDRLFDALQAVQGGFYLGLTIAKPSQRKFRRGWLRRALEELEASGIRLEIA